MKWTVDLSTSLAVPVARFPEFCFETERVSPSEWRQFQEGVTLDDGELTSPIYLGLSSSGKLHVANTSVNRLLVENANSFTVASGFLIYTTTTHVAHFAPLAVMQALLESNTDGTEPLPEWETRRVERGSRIVTAVPSTMSLVLQMPRGNLETINPRPLVMKIVTQDIER